MKAWNRGSGSKMEVNSNARKLGSINCINQMPAQAQALHYTSDEEWLRNFLDVGSVIETAESRFHMAQIRAAILGTLVPSYCKQDELSVDSSYTSLDGSETGWRPGNEPIGSSLREGSWAAMTHPYVAQDNRKLMDLAAAVLAGGRMSEPKADSSTGVNDFTRRSSATGTAAPTSGLLAMDYSDTNACPWSTQGLDPECLGAPPGFPPHPVITHKELNTAAPEFDQLMLNEIQSTMRDASLSHQQYIAGMRGPTPPGFFGVLTGLNTNAKNPLEQATRSRFVGWLKESPSNTKAYAALLNTSESEVDKQLKIAQEYSILKDPSDVKNTGRGGLASQASFTPTGSPSIASSDITVMDEVGEDGSRRHHHVRYRRGGPPGQSTPWCNFCMKSGLGEETFRTHDTNDTVTGETLCPRLLNYKCPLCKETGHTKSYCYKLGGSGTTTGIRFSSSNPRRRWQKFNGTAPT